MPAVETGKKLGGDKGVGKFCSEVVDDQQITVTDIVGDTGCRLRAVPVKSAFRQDVKELGSAEVDH